MADGQTRVVSLNDVLTTEQVRTYTKECLGQDVKFELVGSELKPALEGLAGFLGDHFRIILQVKVGESVQNVHLFAKTLPLFNKPKTEFIDNSNFFRREMLCYKLFEEFDRDHGAYPWHARVFQCDESLVVMPDLNQEGYKTYGNNRTLDLDHVLITATCVARMHAAYANYVTRKSANRPEYNILDDYEEILEEPAFKDSGFIRSAGKLTADMLKEFSKYKDLPEDLEARFQDLYIQACATMKDYDDSLNVIIHKDLWANNIMFKYEDDIPVSALMIDYQCVRYAPPAFDVMSMLYLTTSRRFREEHEREVLDHYHSVFMEYVDAPTAARLKKLHYDRDAFLCWCERARMFGMTLALAIFPFILMDAKSASLFDDRETYDHYVNVDRSEPVMSHARRSASYKDRQMEASEEFLERYVMKTL